MTEQSNLASFLDYYERAHQNAANRYVHHLAHSLGILGALLLLWRLIPAISLIALAFILSWAGHFAFERNIPAFFDAPSSRSPGAGFVKKARVSLGGVVWSGACFMRLFNCGPLARKP